MMRARTIEIDGARMALMAMRGSETLRRTARAAMINRRKPTRSGKTANAADRAGGLPRFPRPDANGHLPAREAIRASIARDVVRARRAAGMSQSTLAKLAGVPQATIVRIEAAKDAPSPSALARIDRAIRAAAGVSNPRRTSSPKTRRTRRS